MNHKGDADMYTGNIKNNDNKNLAEAQPSLRNYNNITHPRPLLPT